MFVSIIIPTCNRESQLSACLNALLSQEADPFLYYEVIVSDDSRLPFRNASLKKYHPRVKWIEGPGCGPATNRNHAARYSNGDWLAFLDDDCIPDPDYLYQIGQTIYSNPSIRLIEGCTYPERRKLRYDEESPENTSGGKLWSCNLVIKRNLFIALQGFCEEFPYPAFEDMDFHLNIQNSFIPVHFSENIRVCHPWRKRKPLAFKLKIIDSIKLLRKRHPGIRQEINRKKLAHSLILGIRGRTLLLIKFRFRGLRAYLEDNIILLYYLIKL